jgi:hypothetical protein
MVRFQKPLILESYPPERMRGKPVQTYRLRAPMVYESHDWGTLWVPAGFETDFASIPRILWWYIDPEDPIIQYISVVHDYIYTRSGSIPGSLLKFSRLDADRVLIEGMKYSGARIDQLVVVWVGTRLFGRRHWGME